METYKNFNNLHAIRICANVYNKICDCKAVNKEISVFFILTAYLLFLKNNIYDSAEGEKVMKDTLEREKIPDVNLRTK